MRLRKNGNTIQYVRSPYLFRMLARFLLSYIKQSINSLTSVNATGSSLPLCSSLTCEPCLVGAETTLLSFPYTLKDTITVEVFPYITQLPDGSNSTSLSTTTLTAAGSVGNASVYGQMFTNLDELTWKVDGVVL